MQPRLYVLRRIRCGSVLAALAIVLFASAPVVHGLVHPDHVIEAWLASSSSQSGGSTDHGKTDDGNHCLLFQLSLTSGHLSSPSVVAEPFGWDVVAYAIPADYRASIAPRYQPRGRGPPPPTSA